MLAEFPAPGEHLIPELHTLSFPKIEVRDSFEIPLEKLAARRNVKAFERVGKQLEIGIFNWQTRGRGCAGAGHIRYTPDFSLSPRGLGKTSCFRFLQGASQRPIEEVSGTTPGRISIFLTFGYLLTTVGYR